MATGTKTVYHSLFLVCKAGQCGFFTFLIFRQTLFIKLQTKCHYRKGIVKKGKIKKKKGKEEKEKEGKGKRGDISSRQSNNLQQPQSFSSSEECKLQKSKIVEKAWTHKSKYLEELREKSIHQ